MAVVSQIWFARITGEDHARAGPESSPQLTRVLEHGRNDRHQHLDQLRIASLDEGDGERPEREPERERDAGDAEPETSEEPFHAPRVAPAGLRAG